jgi:hypothetical protein
VRVERHVDPAGEKGAEQPRGHLDPGLEQQAHPVAGSAVAQQGGAGVLRARQQLAVGRGPPAGLDHRRQAGEPRRHRPEAIADRGRGRRERQMLPGGRERPALGLQPLGGVEQWQITQAALRAGRRRREESPEVLRQARHLRRLEEAGVVDPEDLETARPLRGIEREVELRHLDRRGDRRQHQPGQADLLGRQVEHVEEHPKQRRAAEVAFRRQLLEQALERHVLVGKRLQGRLPHPVEERAEGRVAAEVGPQRQVVEEQADQPLQLAAAAAGDRRAHAEILLPEDAQEERFEGGEQGHEQRSAGRAAETPQGFRQRRGEAQGDLAGPEGVDRRARYRGGQILIGGEPGELAAPVGQLALHPLALEPAALPEGVVGILQGKLGERRRPSLRGGLVERRELAGDHPDRPAVGNDVVHVEEELVLARGQPQQPDCEERAAAQIERLQLVGRGEAGQGGLARRQGGEVDDRQPRGVRRRDPLGRVPAVVGEGGAQHLVAPHQRGERSGECGDVEVAGEAHLQVDAVDRAAGVELVEEPESLLGEGEGEDVGSRLCPEWRRLGGVVAVFGQMFGEPCDGGGLEEESEREVACEGCTDAGECLGAEQGVSAELEEVVVDADG